MIQNESNWMVRAITLTKPDIRPVFLWATISMYLRKTLDLQLAHMRPSLLLFVIANIASTVNGLDPTASVSIGQLPAWSLQRTCGYGCLQNTWDNGADVEKVLGCTWNGCYCGTQYRAAATSIVRSCWSAYCPSEESSLLPYDISTALSIYNAYCEIDGAAMTTTVVPGETLTSFGSGSGGTTVYVTHLTVVTAVTTAVSSTPTNILSLASPSVSACKWLWLIAFVFIVYAV